MNGILITVALTLLCSGLTPAPGTSTAQVQQADSDYFSIQSYVPLPPLLYSGARYSLFYGSSSVTPTFKRVNTLNSSDSHFTPSQLGRSGFQRYRGSAGKK
jgi:hypothetical protein